MKSNPSFCSATPFASCLGLLAVCFFTFVAVSDAKAQSSDSDSVTQQELEDTLKDVLNYYLGGNPVQPTANTVNDYARIIARSLIGSDARFRNLLLGVVGSIPNYSNDLSRVVFLLSGLSGLGDITNGWGYANGDTLHSQMDLIEDYVHALRLSVPTMESRLDSHGVELLVAAPDLEDGLDTLDNDLRTYLTYVLDELSGVELSLDDLAQTIIAYWSQSPASTESAAESAAEDEMEDEEADATDEFESIDLPDADDDDYEPAYTEGTVPDATLGLDDVESPVSHNALIRLVRGSASRSGGNDLPISSSGLPDIEIDFGRDSSLVSGMSRFASWTEWLYGSLFALLFSVKGINMWRMVRVAFLAAGVGENPIVQLAWDPI